MNLVELAAFLPQIVTFMPTILAAIETVEVFRADDPTGKKREDAVVALMGPTLALLEARAGRDLANDAEVEMCLRYFIRFLVSLLEVVASTKARSPVG